jgi:predicted nucleic acid-binding protein
MAKVYVETSIVSYLTARSSRNLIAAAWQKETLDWWDLQRNRFELYISEVVVEEAGRGDKSAASRRLEALEGIQVLELDKRSVELAKTLINHGAVPRKALDDAFHLAVATIHGMDYLLTWNCRHIDNAEMKPKIRKVIESQGYQCPEIATPIELMGVYEND